MMLHAGEKPLSEPLSGPSSGVTFRRTSGSFSVPIRVYYEDTDAGGVVYYANYLKFLERCRTEWLRALGYDQSALLRDPGIAFVVRSVSLEFLKPARLDDVLSVDLVPEKVTRSQLFFRQRIYRISPPHSASGQIEAPGQLLLTARTQVVCVDAGKMKIVSIPAPMRAQLEACQ